MARRVIQNSFSLLNVDRVRLDKKWNYKNVISPYYRLYYIDEGRGLISNGEGKWVLERGYMYLIPAFTLCDLHCEKYLGQYFIHFFEDSGNGISVFNNNRKIYKVKANNRDISMQNRLLEINPGRRINRSDNPKDYEKNIHYQEYEALNNKQSMSVFYETQGILFQLLSRFLSSVNNAEPRHSAVTPKLIDLLGYIQLNLKKNLTVAELARIVNQHPDYMSRMFQKLTAISCWSRT
ncbi:MAG: AraC family transcriptional regulator [Chitinophagaceae bacterium]|nr:MAG: AraC family transcriptional regulator [Chitinophagaceae bacterium]